MKNNKILISSVIFGVGVLATATLIAPKVITEGNAESTMYTMSFSNTKNKIEEDNFSGLLGLETSLGNTVMFEVYELSSSADGWATLGATGVISNFDAITDIKSIEVILRNDNNSTLDLYHGIDNGKGHFEELTPINNTYSFTFSQRTNYIMFEFFNASTSLDITEITITYSCVS